MEKENEIDIEELEAILGIENKTSDINMLFSKQESCPKSFLQAVSLISKSGQFGDVANDYSAPVAFQDPDIQNLVKNATNFFSLDNKDKLKIDFTKPNRKIPLEDIEIIIQETKDNNNQNKNQNANKNKNNVNNNQKDDKEKNKKQKNKKKKKKDDKKNDGKEDTQTQEVNLEDDFNMTENMNTVSNNNNKR